MHRRSVVTVSAAGAVAALIMLVYMVTGGSDIAFGYVLVTGLFVGLVAAGAAAVVLWLVEAANRPGD